MDRRSSVIGGSDALVDVGGYRLRFRIWAGGQPAVLLEAGGGADATYWDALAPELAAATGSTIVAYDRAGYGESDLPSSPYDIGQEIAGLWRGLTQLGLASALIVVGHSYAGLLLLRLASEQPEAVRGLVFVDPMTIEFIGFLGGPYGLTGHPYSQHPFDASQLDVLSKPQLAALRTEAGIPGVYDDLRAKAIPYHISVRVITAGIPWWLTPEESSAWRAAHEHLAASVRDGRMLVAEHSAHLVPDDDPELIVAAVRELVDITHAGAC